MIERLQEGFQMPAVGQYSINKPAAGGYDLTWYLDKAPEKTFEFHPQDVATCRRLQSYQAIPSFQIPSQGGNDHISPIGYQSIGKHSQGVDSALELTDDVLLIAAVIGEENDLLHSHLVVIGDVEKIPYIVEQSALTLFDGEVLTHDNHPVCLAAMGGLIIEFGNLFAREADVFELSFFDHLLLNVFRALPLFCFDFVTRRPLKRLPEALWQGISHIDKLRLGIITKVKIDFFIIYSVFLPCIL